MKCWRMGTTQEKRGTVCGDRDWNYHSPLTVNSFRVENSNKYTNITLVTPIRDDCAIECHSSLVPGDMILPRCSLTTSRRDCDIPNLSGVPQ
jgi:hypothetical protein